MPWARRSRRSQSASSPLSAIRRCGRPGQHGRAVFTSLASPGVRDDAGSADHVGEDVDFGWRARTQGTDLLRAGPPFPPWATRWALTSVASRAAASPDHPALARAASVAVQKPQRDHLLKRLLTVVEGPYSLGQSCQRPPLLRTCRMTERMVRSSLRRAPGWLVGMNGAMTCHCASDDHNSSAEAFCVREALGITFCSSVPYGYWVQTLGSKINQLDQLGKVLFIGG